MAFALHLAAAVAGVMAVAAAQPAAEPCGEASLFKLFVTEEGGKVLGLREGVAGLPGPHAAASELARAYEDMLRPEAAPGSAARHVVSAGPLLDADDQVHCGPLQVAGRKLVADIAYTSARAEGAELRRNLAWRPLVRYDLPATLPPGRYRVEVRWTLRQPAGASSGPQAASASPRIYAADVEVASPGAPGR